ncbi:MAG: hypothetical protein JOZ83_01700 [Silvibacterium sp.]|nr:hypothetical protein [Silvibacterium sp.]
MLGSAAAATAAAQSQPTSESPGSESSTSAEITPGPPAFDPSPAHWRPSRNSPRNFASKGSASATSGGWAFENGTSPRTFLPGVLDLANLNYIFGGTLPASAGAFANICIGVSCLNAVTSGNYNYLIGHSAAQSCTTCFGNNGIGDSILSSVTTGSGNSALGDGVMNNCTTCSLNTGVGASSLSNLTTGVSNFAGGQDALASLTTATGNIGIGQSALASITAVSYNTAVGYYALSKNTAAPNDAFGADALVANTTGVQNAAFGAGALQVNTVSSFNAAFGYAALGASTGGLNTALGAYACSTVTSGSGDTCIGTSAQVAPADVSSTCIGAGCSSSGSHRITIGTSAETVVIPGTLAPANNLGISLTTGPSGANIPDTPFGTVLVSGRYSFCVYLGTISGSGTTGTWQATGVWTSDGYTAPHNLGGLVYATQTGSMNSGVDHLTNNPNCVAVYLDAGSVVMYSMTGFSVNGTPNMRIAASATFLGP